MADTEPPDAQASWNHAADAWSHFVRSGADYYRLLVHGPALLVACQPVRGSKVLDIGCGEGYFSRQLAHAGASVVGIDVSPEQIRFAADEETAQPLGVRYEVGDAGQLVARWTNAAFDMVTACMSVQDMSDADRVAQQVAAVLRPSGRFVFSVPHPATDTVIREWERDEQGNKVALKIDRYFASGPSTMHWNMARLKYHWRTPHVRRTLEEWSALLTTAGFIIGRLLEPRPSAEAVRQHPELDDCARVPYFLIFDTVAV